MMDCSKQTHLVFSCLATQVTLAAEVTMQGAKCSSGAITIHTHTLTQGHFDMSTAGAGEPPTLQIVIERSLSLL